MAILSDDKKFVTVVKGDTLWAIAETYLGSGTRYKELAAINDIPNPDLIYVGQKVYLTKGAGSSGSASASSNKAVVKQFGLLSNADDTLLATWTWSKEKDHTESYKLAWTYNLGDGVWLGSTTENTVDKDYPELSRQSTYKIPDGAKQVRFKVKPISETKDNEKKTVYWTASWSNTSTWTDFTPLATPSKPDIKIEKTKLTASLTNINIEKATHIEFQVYKANSSKPFSTKKAKIITTDASYVFDITLGSDYKVRCRAYNSADKGYSDWSEYSSTEKTVPVAPAGISKLEVLDENSTAVIRVSWTKVENATGYYIEYTDHKIYFDSGATVESVTVGDSDYAIIDGVDMTDGKEYFFRLKATNGIEPGSDWTPIVSIIVGKTPTAPTTWSSTTTAITGKPVNLYWVHNAVDNSRQTRAELLLEIEIPDAGGIAKKTCVFEDIAYDDRMISYTPLTEEEQDAGKINSCVLNTDSFGEGASITWKVRTAGITQVLSEWSVPRTIDVFTPPTLELNVTDESGNMVETLWSFPINIKAIASPATQAPIGYHLSIKSNSIYETVDAIGNPTLVNKDQEVYSKYFDIGSVLETQLSAGDVDLENNIEYTIVCKVHMDSGLTAEASHVFTVAWDDKYYLPNAEIGIDETTMTANIRPYCVDEKTVYYQVDTNFGLYEKTSSVLSSVWGEPVVGSYTLTGEKVYKGVTADGEEVYYCSVLESEIVNNVLLSVYRREFDGSFTELASGLDSSLPTTITDPHPALDYARYRIVATSKETGSVSYYDLPGYLVGGNAVIIQWDEDWSSFDTTEDAPLEQPAWSGSMLVLPYNIDVSESNNSDVSLIEYVGRQHPVSYYGTHLGVSASWSMEIPKTDKETIYALRRLARWMGDVYVREPSGAGYWATISVSFSQKHCELTIPVSLKISQVEGGV